MVATYPYATKDDVYNLALSAQAFVALGRPFDGVDGQTATIRLKAHGYSVKDLITFEVMDGGRLPTGISAFAVYHPIPISADLFKVAPTENGTPFTLWPAVGEGWRVVLDPWRRLDCHLLDAAGIIDEHLTAHQPPILPDDNTGKFPQPLIGINARMAARRAVVSLQMDNAAYKVATERLFAIEAQDERILADWKAGKPIQPRPKDENNVADNSAVGFSDREPIPWSTGLL